MDLVPDLLLEIQRLCSEMRENEDICRTLHSRAQRFLEHIDSMTQDEKESKKTLLFQYQATVRRILHVVRKHYKKHLFIRIWGNHKVVGKLRALYVEMDDLFRLMGLDHIHSMEQFRILAEDAFNKLQGVAENVDVIRAAIDKDDWQEGVVALGVLVEHPESTTVSVGMSDEQVELAKKTFHRAKSVVLEKNKPMPSIPEWFIPRDAVEFEDEFFDRGMYAVMHKGVWGQDGHGTEVAVKCLVADDDRAQDEFKRESKAWFGLDHPNVVKMYGACNKGLPIFFVCEYVKGKNFVDHFETDKSHLWRLFYKAALGLRFLHDNKVIHGDLKCNNILVDGKDNAKICDFGFSYVRDRSNMSAKEKTQAIRWQAPEVLLVSAAEPDAETNPRFASDVFSLGMCVIEAFTGEPPYGLLDDDEVMEKVFEGEVYPRPDSMEDDEWEFVQQLCKRSMTKRMLLSDALDKFKFFADREAANVEKVRLSDDCVVHCDTTLPAGAKFCCDCGLDLTQLS
ncbi:hypothetical protein PHYBOEH_008936 [Phytophthora boehmeriae]|uniref:Protein kinase domain-containing protein n=1 Tax=Phytophthora boehmeriae TaxID=109152 RepID=A0A8T1WZF5_9STRA|nr:hypothetical protein PHYBOEH_008936 [Phytophthora boehmeriae]